MKHLTINATELARELASYDLENNWGDSIYIYEDDEQTTYTEDAQNIYDDLYDKYLSVIESYKIDKNVTTLNSLYDYFGG